MLYDLKKPHQDKRGAGALYFVWQPFTIIQDYLEGYITLQRTVNRLTRPVEGCWDDELDNDVHILLSYLWSTFASVVEQLPHDSSAHEKLASLLMGIKSREAPEGENARIVSYQGELWKDLPGYNVGHRGTWQSPVDKVRSLTARPVDIEADTLGQWGGPSALSEYYTRLNAFLARLVHLPGASEYELYALTALRWALEEDLDAEGLNLNVPGAVMWILYAGEVIWKSEREFGEQEGPRDCWMASTSPLWDETRKHGFCLERWTMWKELFGQVAAMEDVTEETKSLASQAFEKMKWIEQNVPRD